MENLNEEKTTEQNEQLEKKEDAKVEDLDPQTEIKKQFDKEDGIEFSQTLEKDDILNFNLFLIKNDSSTIVKRVFLIFVGVLFIVMSIVTKKSYYMIPIGAVLVIYASVLYNMIRIAMLKSKMNKMSPEVININVKVGKEYIRYQLAEETDSPLVPFRNIYKAVKTDKYLYLFINRYSIIIFKIECIEEVEKLIEQVKARFLPRKNYFEK